MTVTPDIFKEEDRLEEVIQARCDSNEQELIEVVCRLHLLKMVKKRQWQYTKTDARNDATQLLDSRGASSEYSKKGRALIRQVYESKISKAPNNSAETNDLLKAELDKLNQKFHNPDTKFLQLATSKWKPSILNPDEFIQVVNFAFHGRKRDDKGIILSLLIFEIDISEKQLNKAKSNLTSLKKEIQRLTKEYDQFSYLARNSELLTSQFLEVSKDKKKWKKRSLITLSISLLLILSAVYWTLLKPSSEQDVAGNELISLYLSEPLSLLEDQLESEFLLLDESITDEMENFKQLSLRLKNFHSDKIYYLDAVLLSLTDFPAKLSAKPIQSDSPKKAHFFLNDETLNYSLRFYASDAVSSDIRPNQSRLMEVLIAGEEHLHDLEFSFNISVVIHDQFSKTDTVSLSSPYSIRF